ncbi:Blp family class II bacteriocin [Streptococcus caviae]|uniref:Blp family class II bacteriocin n=1 Tax=Streptococcus sp. 'caviae' TaxID=1915004 RepID=UPI00094BAA06|nr:Blp family class II bacteriocin [Streptococcus sp. 'caviae']OLN84660.1 hypothetical protein BMI76_00860 [Streptococcus sp. 'caviae']
MNTQVFEQFEIMTKEELSKIEGGFGGLFLGGAISAFDGGGVTLEQLNGIDRSTPKSCSPYGTGGTPNSCNF